MAASVYLLDTHSLIWFQEDNPKISAQVMEEIQDTANTILFNQVSLIEIAIKQKVGKLPDFKSNTNEIYEQALKDNFIFLPIRNKHIFNYQKVPLLEQHRDPFDRLLVATANDENAVILSDDKNFYLYPELLKRKVYWDPAREQFKNDDEANSMLSRPQRSHYAINK